ncbi:T9SS type A sorting domain-containing protein [candidate division TA06 bacterium]|nr:T9SS type A sorting domain-containing protein [candidate division TA06 bacterium]
MKNILLMTLALAAIFSQTVAQPAVPTLTFPPADTVTNDSFPDFDWADVPTAIQYQLQVARGTRWGYVANYYDGLKIFNLSDTANCFQSGPVVTGSYVNNIFLSETLAVTSSYSEVRLFNVADPRNPFLLKTISVSNYCAVVKDSFLYIGDGNYGMWIYSIADPANPVLAARFDTTSRVRDLAISGNIAYLVGDAALKSVNITDPRNPTLLGSLAVSGDDMALSGNYCYLTNGGSLTVVDVSNPASPVQVGFMNTGPGSYQQLAVKGNFAYIGAGYDGVRVVNISNPAGPFQVALYDTTEYGYDFSQVAVSGDYLITGGEYSGSFLLNISDPYHPRAVNHVEGGSRVYAVALADSFAAMEYDTVLTASSCQSDTFLGDANHYWRVRAGAGTWGDYSPARRFTIDTQTPSKTSHVLPNPGQLINTQKPAFDYSDISDAFRYQLQVCRDSAFTVLEIDTMVSVGGCTLQTALGDGRHWWHVRARDLAGNWAPWSDSTYFRLDTQAPGAPTAITANGANPSLWTKNNSFNVSFTPPFDSSGNQCYYYKYGSAPSSNYDTTGYGYHSTTLPIIAAVQNVGVTPFYVWARDNAGNLDYRNNATVNLRYDTIPPSGAIARSNEFSRTTNFTVSWNDGTDQGGSGLKDYYYIKMKVNSGTWNDLNTYYAGNSYTYAGVQGSKYYFEVAAWDSANNTEVFAGVAECSTLVDNTITAPILVSPYNGAISDSASNAFLWQRATTQTGSRLQCSYRSDFATVVKDTLLAADSLANITLTDSLYYWRVRGQNSASDTSVWSPARILRIDTQAPAAPALALPGNDSLINDNTPQFTWGAVTGAVQFRLAVSPDSAFGSTIVDEETDTTAYTIQVTLPDSAYYWKVKSGDAAGNWSVWSARRKFTVDTKAPAVPVLLNPGDNSTVTTNLPAFIWNTSAQAIQYRLQAANNTSFSPLEMDSALADTAVRPLWGLNDGTHYWRVRCRDLAGNWSAYSNYRTVTVAGLLQVALITPDTGALWAPSQSVWIQFTKPIYTGFIDTTHIKVRGRHTSIVRSTFTWQATSRTLMVAPDTALAANDTITVFIHGTLRDSTNSTTLDGNNSGTASGDSTDSYQMTFRTSFIGDYNSDGLLNGPDLALFTWGWYNYSRYFEAGPYFGTWPHQRIYIGSSTKLDFEDLMGLIYSWNRSGSAKYAPAKQGDPGSLTLESATDGGGMLVKVRPGIEFSSLDVSLRFDPAAGTVTVTASELWNSEGNPQLFLTRQTLGLTEISAALWPGGTKTTGELFRFSLSETKGQTPVSLSYRLYDKDGEVLAEGSLATPMPVKPGLPAVFSFSPARPNPAGHSTVINYQLPCEAVVRLEIYNIAGQKVATLTQGKQPAGYYSKIWDLKDHSGQRVANGVYLFKLQAGDSRGIGKMIVIR